MATLLKGAAFISGAASGKTHSLDNKMLGSLINYYLLITVRNWPTHCNCLR